MTVIGRGWMDGCTYPCCPEDKVVRADIAPDELAGEPPQADKQPGYKSLQEEDDNDDEALTAELHGRGLTGHCR